MIDARDCATSNSLIPSATDDLPPECERERYPDLADPKQLVDLAERASRQILAITQAICDMPESGDQRM